MKAIPIDKEIGFFYEHLERNPRTILSAHFGDGKTYFLNEFKKIYSHEYEIITLHPINYAVNKNEDIFEYIKRDILLQLAGKDEALDFDTDLDALGQSIFSWENIQPVIELIAGFFPGYSELVKKLISKGSKIKDKYEKERNTIGSYNQSFLLQKGGIYENDAFTTLIKNTIGRIKQRGEDERAPNKTMLIVEDLDRLDPGHLFRILNVFGAHIDEDTNSNKFGFDNIVLVLDYDTTQTIFEHFYGKNANYQGYMSKFITLNPFRYSINLVAQNHLLQYLEKECLVSRTMQIGSAVQQPQNATIDSSVRTLNVRDVVSIMDGLEDSIMKTPICIHDGICIDPVAPVTKFLAIMSRIGKKISIGQVITELSKKNMGLVFLGQHLLAEKSILDGAFKYNRERYTVETTVNPENGCTYVEFKRCNNSRDIELDRDTQIEVFKRACNYIHDYYSNPILEN